MAPKPLVSVAIWTCDQRELIGDAIESALAQDYPNVEIVVADDSSSDGTDAVVQNYAQRFPRVVRPILHRGERSVGRNTNRALAACRGDFVASLDGDDMYLPGKLSAQVAVLEAEPSVVLCRHPVEVFEGESGRILGVHDPLPELERATAADLVARGNFVPTASTMMRRAAMPSAVDPAIHHAPDWLLAIETARHGTILRLPQTLARYRRHRGQITAVAAGDDRVFRDALLTLSLVERRFPELAHACRSGRRTVTRWEAARRASESRDLRWTLQGIGHALYHNPADPLLWRAAVSAFGRAGVRAARRTGSSRR